MRASFLSATNRRLRPWRSSHMQRRRTPIRSCLSETSPQTSLRCSGAPPSMQPLALPAHFSPPSKSGGYARRITKLGQLARGRRSRFVSGPPFAHAPGTSRFPFTRLSGKSALITPSCSRSGPARAGPGGSVHTLSRDLPKGVEMGSPSLVRRGKNWWLHTPIEKTFTAPDKVERQITTHPETKMCAVDLNLDRHLAVCSIQTVEGTILATS